MIGKELYEDGGNDAMDNMFYSIEFRIKGEIDKDASHTALGGTTYQTNGNIRNIRSNFSSIGNL